MSEKNTKGTKTKKLEYEEIFNEIFGTSIKWSKLTIEELTQLATVLANPDQLIRKLGGVPLSEVTEASLVKIVKRLIESYEGPIIKILKKYVLSKREGEE